MRVLAARLLVTSTLLLAGCTALSGGPEDTDRTYRRGDESMILCANGGFAAVLVGGIVEGRHAYSYDTGTTIATHGKTGAPAFTLTDHGDGTATTPELGVLAWETVVYDRVEARHASLACEDLEGRSWWTAE